MLRVWKRNSSPTKGKEDVKDIKVDLQRAGHKPEKLDELEKKMMNKLEGDAPNKPPRTEDNSIVAVLSYFEEIGEVKKTPSRSTARH